MSYSSQDRHGSKFGPPIENEKNRILNVQLIYMGYAACETAIPRTALVFRVNKYCMNLFHLKQQPLGSGQGHGL